MPLEWRVIQAVDWHQQLDELVGTQWQSRTGLHVKWSARLSQLMALAEGVLEVGDLKLELVGGQDLQEPKHGL